MQNTIFTTPCRFSANAARKKFLKIPRVNPRRFLSLSFVLRRRERLLHSRILHTMQISPRWEPNKGRRSLSSGSSEEGHKSCSCKKQLRRGQKRGGLKKGEREGGNARRVRACKIHRGRASTARRRRKREGATLSSTIHVNTGIECTYKHIRTFRAPSLFLGTSRRVYVLCRSIPLSPSSFLPPREFLLPRSL